MNKIRLFFAAASVLLFAQSCTENIDTSDRYVFKEETIQGYLSKHSQYSTYYDLLDKMPVSPMSNATPLQLLSARGHYTVFAPTNDAIQEYLDSLVSKEVIPYASFDAFTDSTTLDSIRKVIVYNSIIDSGDEYDYYETATFPTTQDAEITLPNMNDRKLTVHYCDNPDSILINDCLIDPLNKDIPAINGVIHQVHNVIAPSNNSLGFLLKHIIDAGKEGYLVAAKLAEAVGLLDSLDKIRDEEYEALYQAGKLPTSSTNNGETFYTPEHRYFGYTYFAETDSLWSALLGKPVADITVEDVYNYVDGLGLYPDATRDENYMDESNLLNQFVTYHFLPERLTTDHLVYHYNEKGYSTSSKTPSVAIMEFYTTMGKRRLLKTFESRESNGVYLNRFPKLDNGRRGTYHELYCDPDKVGIRIGQPNVEGDNNVRNGMIYPIDEILYYSDITRNCLQSERIRWNVTAMWPEFMNNDIRSNEITDARHASVYIPTDQQFHYLDDVDIYNETEFYYWTGRGKGWQNMQGDEMTIRGLLECTMRLPPVPRRGTYELRFAIQCGGNMRGMVQFYWGNRKDRLAAMGIPMDLRQGTEYRYTKAGNIPSYIGYEPDTDDDDYNSEVDKRMRNNGFMKGCNQYCAGGPGNGTMMRASNICVRRIIIRQTMDPDETYYIKFKTVMDDPTRYFYMDYMEYCAKEVYDNPAEQEDIW